MKDTWENAISCAIKCSRCEKKLSADDKRILSVVDHQPICMKCKQEEENRPDYEEISKNVIGRCLIETEQMYGDPGGYCFYHFYPYTCPE
ncbi:MAG: hypothetical protein R6U27_15755 [Desulfobacterales bacterium]